MGGGVAGSLPDTDEDSGARQMVLVSVIPGELLLSSVPPPWRACGFR